MIKTACILLEMLIGRRGLTRQVTKYLRTNKLCMVASLRKTAAQFLHYKLRKQLELTFKCQLSCQSIDKVICGTDLLLAIIQRHILSIRCLLLTEL